MDDGTREPSRVWLLVPTALALSAWVVGGIAFSYTTLAVAEVLVVLTVLAVAAFAFACMERGSPGPGDVVIRLATSLGIGVFVAFGVELILWVVIFTRAF